MTRPYPGQSGQPTAHPARLPHESVRQGTAKMLTLLHPATGEVHVKGVPRVTNGVLYGWLQEELTAILATLPLPAEEPHGEERRALWTRWQEGLRVKPSLPADPPPLRLLPCWTTWPATRRRPLCAGCLPTGSCPSIRLWVAVG